MGAINDIAGVTLTPLKIIPVDRGDVLHGLRTDAPGYVSFGEAYFSTVLDGAVKGWKKHTRMTLNLVVPVGAVRFVVVDDREGSTTRGQWGDVTLSRENYQRLTVEPGLWMAFQGASPNENMLLNVASIPHDPTEAENKPLNDADFPAIPGF